MLNIIRRSLLTGMAAALALSMNAGIGVAAYPDRPVKFTSGFPPGDIEDLLTRLIVDKMTAMTGVPAAMINKPGGAASVAAVGVLEQPADGSNVGAFPLAVPIVHPLRHHEVLKRDSFEPVVIFLTFPVVVVTKKESPYNNFAELAKASETTPVKLGHFGAGTLATLGTKFLINKLGVKIAGEATFDEVNCATVLNGDADIAVATVQTVLPCLTSGEVKAIGAMNAERLPIAPNAPTFHEQLPEFDISSWFGLYVKTGTPQEVKDKLIEVARAALDSDEARKIAAQANAPLMFRAGPDAVAWVNGQYPLIEALLKEMGE